MSELSLVFYVQFSSNLHKSKHSIRHIFSAYRSVYLDHPIAKYDISCRAKLQIINQIEPFEARVKPLGEFVVRNV